jgi:hypothetical protein
VRAFRDARTGDLLQAILDEIDNGLLAEGESVKLEILARDLLHLITLYLVEVDAQAALRDLGPLLESSLRV